MAGGGSRGIHAARPTERHLRSACTQVAIFVVWTDVRLEARSRSTANTAVRLDAIPVGDAGGHDGSDSGLSVADESPDLPLSSHRRPGCQSSSVSHRVSCTAGNLDTPRNRGAADRDLANARPVSPSASYLKRHQVTKCPCSWFGGSFVAVPSLRRRFVGPPPSAIHGGGRLSRHPCRSAHCATPAFSLHPSRDLWWLGCGALKARARARDAALSLSRSGLLAVAISNTPRGQAGLLQGCVSIRDLKLNINPCGRSWSCATAAIAVDQTAYLLNDAPLLLPSWPPASPTGIASAFESRVGF
jgi:hypothetical protein